MPWIPETYLEHCQTSMMGIRCLERSKLLYPSRKKFMLLNYTEYISPDEILELFVEVNVDLSTGYNVYSMYLNLSRLNSLVQF